jgi:hypothetical protein
MMRNNIIITVLLLIIVAGASFFAGVKYQEAQRSSWARQMMGNGMGSGRMGGVLPGMGNRLGLRPVNGEIISAEEKSLTVKLADGSSRIVLLADKTTINKATEATKDDLQVGEKVAIFGQENADGSVTAQSIQLNPVLRGGASPTTP